MSDGYSDRVAGKPTMNAIIDHNQCPDQTPDDPGKHEFTRRTVLGTFVGLFSVGLFLALLLLVVLTESEITVAGGVGDSGSGSGNGNSLGVGNAIEGNGTAATTGGGQGDVGKRAPDVTIASQTEQPKSVELAEQVVDDQLVAKSEDESPTRQPTATRTEYSIAPLPSASEQPRTGSGGDGGAAGVGGAGGDEQQRELMGVKVKGSIALVCDVSGSMYNDFPPLYKELRTRFPTSTPLILVPGCAFYQPTQSEVKKLSPEEAAYVVAPGIPGIERDKNIYSAQNTTDAIIFAVEKLKRRTVMFNCDLQDGGSESAIDAFEKLLRRHRFTLSGRSLNCKAPKCLLNFIRKSDGDFQVDTISRASAEAVPWGP